VEGRKVVSLVVETGRVVEEEGIVEKEEGTVATTGIEFTATLRRGSAEYSEETGKVLAIEGTSEVMFLETVVLLCCHWSQPGVIPCPCPPCIIDAIGIPPWPAGKAVIPSYIEGGMAAIPVWFTKGCP